MAGRSQSDDEARRARADRLRKAVEERKRGVEPRPAPTNPRDFIEDRMKHPPTPAEKPSPSG